MHKKTKKRIPMLTKYAKTLAATMLLTPSAAAAQNYFDVMTMECSEKNATAAFEGKVDFPVGGGEAVVYSAKQWIGQVLEVDATMAEQEAGNMTADGFARLLDDVARDFAEKNSGTKRRVDITWMYEDPSCVTYEAVTTDRDSTTWTTTDIACFAKSDGHRVQPSEIFSCDEQQIKRLMWKYRGDKRMEVARAEDLYVGQCGFIDGWVIVVGPAEGTSGAEYRLRYPEIEQWLVPAKGGGYLAQ